MTYDKITHGYVIQRFNDKGECVGQEFCSVDIVEYEHNGNIISVNDMPLKGGEYNPFPMVQPLSLPYLEYVIEQNNQKNNS